MSRHPRISRPRAPIPSLALVLLAGCQAQPGSIDPSLLLGGDPVVGQSAPIPSGATADGPTSGPLPAIGPSCQGGSSICLALKYVSYVDPSDNAPIVSQSEAVANVQSINQLWNQCGVQFQMEKYLAAKPADYQLNFQTQSYAELDQVRTAFADNGEMLVVTTGTWDRSGTLGESTANAWTAMPGTGVHGTVLEEPVSGFANIIAHELGHYLNLVHVTDDTDLMNPIIFTDSAVLSSDQCSGTRTAAAFFWPQMYR
jgi:hypothetical protein